MIRIIAERQANWANMNQENENPGLSGPSENAPPAYPFDCIDIRRFNQIIRHRVRNLCGGCRMILDTLHKTSGGAGRMPWQSLYNEVEDMQTFSRRLDLLIEPLPEPEALPLSGILSEAGSTFAERFPLCSLTFDGPDTECELRSGNWCAAALEELLDNAGQAAGQNGTVEIAWTTSPFQIVVANDGVPFPQSIPTHPPIPFRTTRPANDGLGLSLIYRLCLAMNLSLQVRNDLTDMTAAILAPPPTRNNSNET